MQKKLAFFCNFAILFFVEKAINIDQNYLPKTLEEAIIIIQELRNDLSIMKQQLAVLLRDKYGKSSEKQLPEECQLNLFAENESSEETAEDQVETITYTRTKRNGHRNIPDTLPRVRIEYELPDLTCPCGCGNQLHKIGEVITEQLEIVPAKIYVNEHVRFKYAGCAHQDKVITAAMPNQPIDKGFAGPGLLADVLVKKYDDHLPLYRQSEILARHGIDLSRKTMCDWVMQCADLLNPIVEAMKPDLLTSPKIHTDDTTIPVLQKSGGTTKTGRLWVYSGCKPPCIIYEYSPDRQQIWSMEFLKDYRGYLQADAYTGYDKIYASGNIIEVACMAHARRKFFEVAQANNKSTGSKVGIAVTALNYISRLYKIESKIKDLDVFEKKELRKKEAEPILKDYEIWLLKQSTRVLPKSPLGLAISYTLNNWIALTRYLENGILSIDNNEAERLMKPITVGRKNYLFTGSDRGGKAAATIYSLIESCKINKINPYTYLRDILTRLPNTLNRDIRSLLPYIWKPPRDS